MMINLQTYLNWVEDKINNSNLESFSLDINESKVKMFVKRDDLIHETISGNKLRKLKYNVVAAIEQNCTRLVTFGGAFSNHLLATAFLCVEFQIPLTLMVRGEELNQFSNKILSYCHQQGIQLIFLTRDNYKTIKRKTGVHYLGTEKCWFIPEGGANSEGVKGTEEIIDGITKFDIYVVAQGTTTTSIGIYNKMSDDSTLYVIPALKNFQSKDEMISISPSSDYRKKLISLNYDEMGRYGKKTSALSDFEKKIKNQIHFELDPIYTLKALYAFCKYTSTNHSELLSEKKILFVHTGGLNQNWWE